MTTQTQLACALLLMTGAIAHAAEAAHVHGVARLDVAVESTKLTIQLESPLDNLVGFERAPRTDAERALVNTAVARLKAADAMFKIDPAGQCKLTKVDLASAALKLGTPDPEEVKAGHADIDGSFEFDCADAAKARFVDVDLFSFPHLQRLEIQAATPPGQFKQSLKRPAQRVAQRVVLTK